MEDAIDAIEEITHDQHLGNAVNYTRTHSYSGAGRYIATMQAVAYSLGVFGFKAYTITPEHQAFYVYLYSLEIFICYFHYHSPYLFYLHHILYSCLLFD